ncbi:hypothetical protein O181_102495 [Austropuccinia psidii MF-1]|uniref:Uncharacterized protein n=1 Tax=Austropuccinia psidii MF-1 TaxID=1389203 RepID=A0A9Q3JJN6_9BASI|nr:hypothetical protein [Austropuccinia psidii MF-1]
MRLLPPPACSSHPFTIPTLTHELASTSPPNPLLPLTCLHSHTALKICLCSSAPISALTHPHTSAPLPLKMLTLPLCPQDILLMPAPHLRALSFHLQTPPCLLRRLKSLHSRSALPTCLCFRPNTSLHFCTPPLTILTLLLHPQDILLTPEPHLCAPATYNPYAHIVPS